MAELTTEDVEFFTGGRLGDGIETERLLAAALAVARKHCGWQVNLVSEQQVMVDSPGGKVLSLPTLNLVSLDAVSEDGADVDVSTLRYSTRTASVTKKSGASWKPGLGVVEVTMTHGYEDPADFHQAVLTMVDRMSTIPAVAGQRDSSGLSRKKVDDVEYEWFATAQPILDDQIQSLLAPYRLILSP